MNILSEAFLVVYLGNILKIALVYQQSFFGVRVGGSHIVFSEAEFMRK